MNVRKIYLVAPVPRQSHPVHRMRETEYYEEYRPHFYTDSHVDAMALAWTKARESREIWGVFELTAAYEAERVPPKVNHCEIVDPDVKTAEE